MGKTFWAGGIEAMSEHDPREVELALHELSRKDLIRPARTSSIEGEAEYGFWHILVRDVCYAQIPRVSRAARHRAAGEWLEGKAGNRSDDTADVIAHHFLQALELTRASGRDVDVPELEAQALHYLTLAADRAIALDVERAEHSLARALALAPAGHPERAHLLERWADAAQQQGRLREAKAALEEAISLYREQGEAISTGRSLTRLPTVLAAIGDPNREEPLAEAISILETQPPGPDLVSAYGELAGLKNVFLSDYPAAVNAADRALQLADELGLQEPARARGFRGTALALLGHRAGLDDLRRAIVLAVEQGRSRDASVFQNNLSEALRFYDGPAAALEVGRDAVEFCRRRGVAEQERYIAAQLPSDLVEIGRPIEALAESDAITAALSATGAVGRIHVLVVRLRILTEQGHTTRADADAEELVDAVRETGELQHLTLGLAAAALRLTARGQHDDALALLRELDRTPRIHADVNFAATLPELTRCALAAGDAALAGRLAAGVEPLTRRHATALCAARAQLTEASSDPRTAAALFAEAAEGWRDLGIVPERAYALLGQGRCRVAVGDPTARTVLLEARDLFASLGYQPAIAQTDSLLGETHAAPV